jgi:hypothetical protein
MTRRCAYCRATADLEPVSPASASQACRVTELCQLRAAGLDPVELALTVARGLAKLAWHDTEARNAAGPAGSPESAAYAPSLANADLARLHLVLDAAAGRIDPGGQADCAEQLRRARADLGCRTCGAIGREDCTTSGGLPVPRTHGTWGPNWHAGRTL